MILWVVCVVKYQCFVIIFLIWLIKPKDSWLTRSSCFLIQAHVLIVHTIDHSTVICQRKT